MEVNTTRRKSVYQDALFAFDKAASNESSPSLQESIEARLLKTNVLQLFPKHDNVTKNLFGTMFDVTNRCRFGCARVLAEYGKYRYKLFMRKTKSRYEKKLVSVGGLSETDDVVVNTNSTNDDKRENASNTSNNSNSNSTNSTNSTNSNYSNDKNSWNDNTTNDNSSKGNKNKKCSIEEMKRILNNSSSTNSNGSHDNSSNCNDDSSNKNIDKKYSIEEIERMDKEIDRKEFGEILEMLRRAWQCSARQSQFDRIFEMNGICIAGITIARILKDIEIPKGHNYFSLLWYDMIKNKIENFTKEISQSFKSMFYYEYNCVILETLIFLKDKFKEPKKRHTSIIHSIESSSSSSDYSCNESDDPNRPFVLWVDEIDDILNDEYNEIYGENCHPFWKISSTNKKRFLKEGIEQLKKQFHDNWQKIKIHMTDFIDTNNCLTQNEIGKRYVLMAKYQLRYCHNINQTLSFCRKAIDADQTNRYAQNKIEQYKDWS